MEEALKLVEELIKEREEKVELDLDITIESNERGYRYALEDVRDEIKSRIIMSKMKSPACGGS